MLPLIRNQPKMVQQNPQPRALIFNHVGLQITNTLESDSRASRNPR